jgi:hypothetical protein
VGWCNGSTLIVASTTTYKRSFMLRRQTLVRFRSPPNAFKNTGGIMNLNKRNINYLNKEWEKKHNPVKQEWDYLESEAQYKHRIEKRNERIIFAIILFMLIASIVATRLLKYYEILG